MMEFSEFCNICYKQENLINISREENSTLLNTFTTLIAQQETVDGNVVYLCLCCCNKLEDITKFRDMCITNFIHFRQSCHDFKRKLEIKKDPDINIKVKKFINTKVRKQYIDAENERLRTETYNSTEAEDSEVQLKQIFIKQEPDEVENEIETTLDYSINNHVSFEPENIKSEIFDYDYQLESEIDLGITNFVEAEQNLFITSNENVNNNVLVSCENSSDEEIHTEISPQKLRKSKRNGGRERHVCNVCKRSFPSLDNMEKHRYIHIGEKTPRCNLCKKTFSTTRYLKVHQILHTGEKPYECDICQKAFAYSSNRNRHRLIHTGGKHTRRH